MSKYLLVHGAWHTGGELGAVATAIKAAGHEVLTPTLAGNRPGDSKSTGLAEAIGSMIEYVVENNLAEIILVGHSYGGMIITGVADAAPERLRRLVYWNAFVPNDDESVSDMLPSVALARSGRSRAGGLFGVRVSLPRGALRRLFIAGDARRPRRPAALHQRAVPAL